MRKKLLSIIFAIGMALTALVVPAVAADEDRGSYKPYPEAAYELTYLENEDETLTIIGYTGRAGGELFLPDQINDKPVTSIGEYAFMHCVV